MKGPPKTRRITWIVLALIGALLFFTLGFDREFDAAAWRAQVGDVGILGNAPRQAMVDDLMESKLLDGKTRTEVIALLGDDGIYPEPTSQGAGSMFYYLGPHFPLDSDILQITFDQTGSVISYRTYHS